MVAMLPSTLFALWASLSGAAGEPESIRLLFAGDVMAHRSMWGAAPRRFDPEYEFDDEFELVKPWVEDADWAIANLEFVLPGKPPYSGYPRFRSPRGLADGLKKVGFDVVLTANNHSYDAGLLGIDRTLQQLGDVGLQHTGTFENEDDRAQRTPLMLESK